jgi:hypothetical protein
MQPEEILEFLNGRAKYPEMDYKLLNWRNVYYDISLHTLGICPRFSIGARQINPSGWYHNKYHEQYQFRFINYLLNRHPRESEETLNWRLSRYKPLTKAPFQRVTEMVTGAIFQDGNYSIEIPDPKDSEYIWGNNFYGRNIIGYFSEMGYKNMVEDPNGIFIRMPSRPYYEYAQGEQVEVNIWFINSTHIKYITRDEVIFCKDGYAWHVDKQTIWRYKEEKENLYILDPEDSEGYYAHMFGKLPISIAGGEWNSKEYYDSYYDKARPAADVFIDVFSAQQLVDKNASYPFISEVADECPTCHGTLKLQTCERCHTSSEHCKCGEQANWRLLDCNTCGGAGVIASDPSKRKIIPLDDWDKSKGGVVITSPDIGVNKHHFDQSKEIMKLILDALHLTVIDEAQSGAAKAIDQDRLYKFVSKISNHMFDNLIYKTISDIIAYRHVVASPNGVTPSVYQFKIVKPQQFDIKTAQLLLDEFKTAQEGKMPKYILAQHVIDYADKQYSGNDTVKKKAVMVTQIDPYSLHSVEEKLSLKVSGAITTEQMILSDMLPLIMDRIVRDKGDEWFQEADFDAINGEVQRLKSEYLPKPNELQQQALLNMQSESVRVEA